MGEEMGFECMNMVEASVERSNGGVQLKVGDQALALAPETLQAKPRLAEYEGRTVVLGIRPEDLHDAALADDVPPNQRLRGNVELREGLGSEIVVHVSVNARPAVTEDVRELAADIGDERSVDEAAKEQQSTLVARFPAGARVQEGETIEMAVDTPSLHFFDPETGLGIYDHQPKGVT